MLPARSIGYFTRQAWLQFVRDRTLSTTAFLANLATLFMSALFLLVAFNLEEGLRSFRDHRDVQVFFHPSTTSEDWDRAARAIGSIEGVDAVELMTPDDAMAEFEAEFGESGLVDALGMNPLPASCRLSVASTSMAQVDEVASRIAALPQVETVQRGGEMVGLVQARVRTLSRITLVVGIAVGLSAILIIANTIRLTILARSELIGILKSIGAGDGFVRFPFVLEGALHGSVAGLFSIALLWGIHALVARRVAGTHFFDVAAMLAFVAFSAVLGVFGAAVATRPALREWGRAE